MPFFDYQFSKTALEKKVDSRGKVYIECSVRFDSNGLMRPLKIKFDGQEYEIDNATLVNEARYGADLKYRVRIMGKWTNLFMECGRWFVMGK